MTEVIFYTKQLGTYSKNIDSFMKLFNACLDRLTEHAGIGTKLSSRIEIETNIKYCMVEQ